MLALPRAIGSSERIRPLAPAHIYQHAHDWPSRLLPDICQGPDTHAPNMTCKRQLMFPLYQCYG